MRVGKLNVVGGQVTFPATQNPSSNVNTLDDYEEGSWTPVLNDGSNNATMHALNSGTYTKIGRLVFVTARVQTSSLGSVSGNLYISGLPFTVGNVNANYGGGCTVGYGGGLAITAGYSVSAIPVSNTTTLRLYVWDATTGTTAMQHSEWTDDGQAYLHGLYHVA